ncbi:hypothetical protein V8G54_025682 [Vigna mungo]|uniref:Uncharacterized protein n=1 Tax=Vigna mungo TaxID=3915 RepID=A0AAQ3RNK8_VIGMU
MNLGSESPTSSPPTPPSPLPISFGPGNRTYSFSVSSTSSPPFSLAPSSHPSHDNLPLLHKTLPTTNVPYAFSLDHQELESKNTCLKDLGDAKLCKLLFVGTGYAELSFYQGFKQNHPCLVLITADFAVSVERNLGDSVVCFEVSPSQIEDSEHSMPCYQMPVNHVVVAAAAVWASYHWDCHLPC